NNNNNNNSSSTNNNNLDMLKNVLNSNGSSNANLENLMNLFNSFSNKGNSDHTNDASHNKDNGANGKAAHPLEHLTSLLGNLGGKNSGDGSGGKGSNPMEHLTSLLGNMGGKNSGDGSGGKGSNPMEHLTSLLGNLGGKNSGDGSGGKGSNPMEHLTELLGHLGGKNSGDGSGGKGSNPMEHLTELLGHLGGKNSGDGSGGKGSNPLEHLTSLLGNMGGKNSGDGSGGKDSNPMEHLTSLLGNLGGKNSGDGSGGKGSNPLEHLTELLGHLNNNNKDENKSGNNNKVIGDIQSILGKFLNSEKNKNAPFSLDKSVTDGSTKSKESILLEYNKKERDLINELQNLIKKSKENMNNKELNEKNEKLKTFFSSLRDKYNPYSYERKLLDDLISENDIKNKYNIDDSFEKNIFIHEKDDVVYEQMSDAEKEKKTEMFEDINELDEHETVESGSINSNMLRKNKMENASVLRGLISGESDNLHECNCSSHKNKNCIFSYINYSNLEYMLESLDIDVKSMVKEHIDSYKNAKHHFKKSDSFLVPLLPLNVKSNIQNTSKYILRVPRVLFLSTKKAFSTSLDRYFFNLYDVMENQLKWNTYIWGYGFKHYPLFFSKNLHTLLHNYDKQIGSEPFDLIFVHSSFVSNYYNHYFFLKNMPKLTTLIFISDGWDNNVKNTYLNLFPHIFFQNQVNIFEYNPISSIDTAAERRKLHNSLWNKVSNSRTNDIITNKHKKKKEGKKGSSSPGDDTEEETLDKDDPNSGYYNSMNGTNNDYNDDDDDDNKTLWAFLPHAVNPCCFKKFDKCFEVKENEPNNRGGISPTYYYDLARKIGNRHNPSVELSYSLLDLFLPVCTFKDPSSLFNSFTRDIDILYLYNTTSSNYNDFLIQKIMDYIYNKNMNNLKDKIYKYEVDLYYWKVWGLQTTHKLIKNKMKEYYNILQRSKVCVISSKFAGMLNKTVIDAMLNGCVVITDKGHNKDVNKFLVTTRIPYEYYEISDLIYNNENMNSLAANLVEKINTTLDQVNKGKKNTMKIEAFKMVLNTYTYPGVILNWILPTLYFHYNKEKYELINNYFVLPQYFDKVISKSLKTTSAKREKIIANIDLSLQEDLIMNNNEVATWYIIWIVIFVVVLFYIIRNSNILSLIFKQRKLHL
ncbi:conserved Plasmodium protein, unknown function, partial [Plasmodium malariae]